MASDYYQIGDTVRCDVNVYQSYKKGQTATVLGVEFSNSGNLLLVLENTMCEFGRSQYVAVNWTIVKRVQAAEPKKEAKTVAYEKTKYFGILTVDTDGCSELQLGDRRTNLCDSKSEALKLTQELMGKGETWIILQTIALLEPEVPRPPIKITEYR